MHFEQGQLLLRQITLLLLMIPNVISWLLLPKVTASQQTAIEITCRTSRYTLAIMLLACVSAIPASFILPVVYGTGFEAIPMIVLLLLPGTFFLSLQMIIVQYFVGTGLPLIISLLWVATLVLNILLNIFIYKSIRKCSFSSSETSFKIYKRI